MVSVKPGWGRTEDALEEPKVFAETRKPEWKTR